MEEKQQNPEFEERDATLDPDPVPTAMSDDELQESILEDSGMNAFQKTLARMDDKKWALVQRVVGALMGLLCGVALFWNTSDSQQGGFSYSLIIAVLIALVLPNIIEKQGMRRAPQLRIAMVITLAIMIVAFFIITLLNKGFGG